MSLFYSKLELKCITNYTIVTILQTQAGLYNLQSSLPTSTILLLKFPSYSYNEWPGDV